jgi:hypothetical protein
MNASAEIRGVRRAALLVMVAAAGLLGGCGDATPAPKTATAAAAAAACTRPALLQALRGLGTANPLAVRAFRCADGYALTRVREGATRSVILWQGVTGRWEQVARDAPDACPQQAAAHALCKPPPADPTLTRCTEHAFQNALRADVDKLRFHVDQIRCRGGFARTRFTISDCKPEQTTGLQYCQRKRVAAWRRTATRWKLITYTPALDCNVVQAASPKFPDSLCG